MRILVADDQPEVVKSLLAPLLKAASEYRVVSDATSAIDVIRGKPCFDVLIVDMQMPPGQWGGLDLIRWVREDGIGVPIVVISGEGGQRETIEALRLGANDWIQKEKAFDEAHSRVSSLVAERDANALANRPIRLPGLVDKHLAHFQEARLDPAKEIEGQLALMAALESTWRFASLVGMADARSGGLRISGVRPDQLVRPSMGTYADLVRRLQRSVPPSATSRALLACVDLVDAQTITAARNRGLAHPTDRASLAPAAKRAAEKALETFLRRFGEWCPGVLATVDNMQFDGTEFSLSMHVMASPPSQRVTVRSKEPATAGRIYWVVGNAFVDCTPFLLVGEGGAEVTFDGIKTRGRDASADSEMVYAIGQERLSQPLGGTFQDILDCLG